MSIASKIDRVYVRLCSAYPRSVKIVILELDKEETMDEPRGIDYHENFVYAEIFCIDSTVL